MIGISLGMMITFSRLQPFIAITAAMCVAAGRIHAQTGESSPLPPPTGAHAVGRAQFAWIDDSRADPQTPSRHREIVVWIWYPAIPRPGAQHAEWMPGKWGEVFQSEYAKSHPGTGVSASAVSIRTHAYADAAPESGSHRYPVLLFAPGLGTTPLDYSAIIEDVASHGYVVIGVVSPDFGRASIFPDGRVIPGHDPMDSLRRAGVRLTAALALHAWESATHDYAKDVSFALARLASTDTGALAREAEPARVGVFGHSLGGAAALQCANDDPRVRAVFDIDGSPFWSAENGPMRKPVLVLSAASTNLNYDAVLDGATPGRQLMVAGTAHAFSSDVGMMPFVAARARSATGAGGSIEPARALRITSAYLVAFFDEYLNGQRRALLRGPSPAYPEVTFERGPLQNR